MPLYGPGAFRRLASRETQRAADLGLTPARRAAAQWIRSRSGARLRNPQNAMQKHRLVGRRSLWTADLARKIGRNAFPLLIAQNQTIQRPAPILEALTGPKAGLVLMEKEALS